MMIQNVLYILLIVIMSIGSINAIGACVVPEPPIEPPVEPSVEPPVTPPTDPPVVEENNTTTVINEPVTVQDKTIPMQKTGNELIYLVLALLLVIIGLAVAYRKGKI